MRGSIDEQGIWSARGGHGERLVLLLHGLAANASVWRGTAAALEMRGMRWVAPDFRGHGRSLKTGPYCYGIHAADIAALLADEDMQRVTILGHSFGGVIGALLGSGLFGPVPRAVVGLGVKLDWTETEVAGGRKLAERPAKTWATREQAAERYLKFSGLKGVVDADSAEVEHGIVATEHGFGLAMDPRVFSAIGPSIDAIFKMLASPLRLAAGSRDAMVSQAQMRRHDEKASVLADLGHNAHVESPGEVLTLLDENA